MKTMSPQKVFTYLLTFSILCYLASGQNRASAAEEDKDQKILTLWQGYQQQMDSPHDPADDARIRSSYWTAVDQVRNEQSFSTSTPPAEKSLLNIMFSGPERRDVLLVISPTSPTNQLMAGIERFMSQILNYNSYDAVFRKTYFDLYLKDKHESVEVEQGGVKREVTLTNSFLLTEAALKSHLAQHPEILKQLTDAKTQQPFFAAMLDRIIPLYSGAFEQKLGLTVTADPHLVAVFNLVSHPLPAPDKLPKDGTLADYKQNQAKQIGDEFKGAVEGADKELARSEIRQEMRARYGEDGDKLWAQYIKLQMTSDSLTPEQTHTRILDELDEIAAIKNHGGSASPIEPQKQAIIAAIKALVHGKDHETVKQVARDAGLLGRGLAMRLRDEAGIDVLSLMREESSLSGETPGENSNFPVRGRTRTPKGLDTRSLNEGEIVRSVRDHPETARQVLTDNLAELPMDDSKRMTVLMMLQENAAGKMDHGFSTLEMVTAADRSEVAKYVLGPDAAADAMLIANGIRAGLSPQRACAQIKAPGSKSGELWTHRAEAVVHYNAIERSDSMPKLDQNGGNLLRSK